MYIYIVLVLWYHYGIIIVYPRAMYLRYGVVSPCLEPSFLELLDPGPGVQECLDADRPSAFHWFEGSFKKQAKRPRSSEIMLNPAKSR